MPLPEGACCVSSSAGVFAEPGFIVPAPPVSAVEAPALVVVAAMDTVSGVALLVGLVHPVSASAASSVVRVARGSLLFMLHLTTQSVLDVTQ